MIETRLLCYFLAIAREQSITRAAESLNITQPTLSKQMMELEEQLGRKLFRVLAVAVAYHQELVPQIHLVHIF